MLTFLLIRFGLKNGYKEISSGFRLKCLQLDFVIQGDN